MNSHNIPDSLFANAQLLRAWSSLATLEQWVRDGGVAQRGVSILQHEDGCAVALTIPGGLCITAAHAVVRKNPFDALAQAAQVVATNPTLEGCEELDNAAASTATPAITPELAEKISEARVQLMLKLQTVESIVQGMLQVVDNIGRIAATDPEQAKGLAGELVDVEDDTFGNSSATSPLLWHVNQVQ